MSKIEQLAKNLPDGVDAALILSDENRLYYTEMESTAGTLFVTREAAYLVIDFRYIEAARNRVRDCQVILQDKLADQINELIARHQVKAVAIESGYATVAQYLYWKKRIRDARLLMDEKLNDVILHQRRFKTEQEIKLIQQAQNIADEAFEFALNRIKPGLTELELELDMEFFCRGKGSQGVSFPFIVVSGKNSALPHGVPTTKPIEAGDFVTMDFGAVIDGYRSDMTRTVAVGKVSDEQKLVYDTVLKAQLEAEKAVCPGKSCFEIDKIARDIIHEAGFEGCFGHGLGHSVGIEIHEEPRFSPASTDQCEAGIVMTIEPGIYLEGRFGCRIEDMVLITADGSHNFAHSSKNLIIL